MPKSEVESAQINYLKDLTMDEYLQSYNYKTMRKLISICGSGHKILDVGCGDGFIGKILQDNGNDVIGVDLGEEQVRETKKKGVKALVAKVQKLPFKNNTFDIVTMAEVIEHFLETEEALKEIKRVLKPGGKIIITTPNFASMRDRILMVFGKLQAFALHKDHIKFFNKARLVAVLKEGGYRAIKVHGSAFGVPIPKNAQVTYALDGILPATWMQCLIAEARKPLK